MFKKLFFFLVLIYGYSLYSQQTNCKVLMASISGTYSGACKKGLAHGKGVAQGTDYYDGQFNKGLPEGKGTYKWANGESYEGQWKAGLREGEGKMVFMDSVVTGYWNEDKYVGKERIAKYEIIHSMSVSRYSIRNSIGTIPGVKIRFMQGGTDNSGIEDLSLSYDSGDEYRSGIIYGIQNTIFPLYVKVRYRSWNQFHTAQFNVVFEFKINEPGSWDVVITN